MLLTLIESHKKFVFSENLQKLYLRKEEYTSNTSNNFLTFLKILDRG